MAANCFKDNCFGNWAEVVTDTGPAYEYSLNIDANSTLYCDAPTGGLDVKVAATVGNLITKDGVGALLALIPPAAHVAQDNDQLDYIAVPSGANAAAPAEAQLDIEYENTTAVEQLLIIRGQFELHYDVMWEGNPATDANLLRSGDIVTRDPGAVGGDVPSRQLNVFNAQVIMRLKQSSNGGAFTGVLVEHDSLSGVVPNIDENQSKSWYENFVWIVPIAPGQTLRYKADVFFDGEDQTLNLLARPASQAPNRRGFRVSGVDIYALPIPVA